DPPDGARRRSPRPRPDVTRRSLEGAHRAMKSLRVLAALALVLCATSSARAFDPEQTFKKGGFVLSLDGGGGSQNDLERHGRQTDLDLWWIQGRASLLPLGTTGKD